jgi:UDP-galactopyranose mutase
MPFGDGIELYNKYNELAKKEKNVVFIGRLATYKYLDMWMAIKQAMQKVELI